MNYEFIKELIEEKSGIDDIGIKSRKQFVKDCRYVYCQLSKMYVDDFSLASCGKLINRDHATVYYGLGIFNKDYGTKSFLANNIYDICNPILKYMYIEEISKDANEKIESLNELISSYKSIRNKLIKELNNKL